MNGTPNQGRWHSAITSAWLHRGWLALLLWPLSVIFGAVAGLRRALYRAGLFKTERLSVPVIVVGNVVAGGSGKTPVVMALVRHLQQQGVAAGVVSRGYGRRTHDCREVLADSRASDVGDEPALIRRSTAVPVFVAARRIDAARSLLERYPKTQVIVCDDGLQHLNLHRDLEICVFDDRGIGNGLLLPAGPLREPWPRGADLVLHTGLKPAFEGFTAQRSLADQAVRSDGSEIALTELTQAGARPVLAVAAIAKPQEFFAMLRARGVTLAATVALRDHYAFNSWSSNDYDGYTVICTEKDAVKLWQRQPGALAVPLRVTPQPAFMNKIDAWLASQRVPTLSSPHGHSTT